MITFDDLAILAHKCDRHLESSNGQRASLKLFSFNSILLSSSFWF